VLDSIRNNVMIDGAEHEMPSNTYPNDYGVPSTAKESETNIDFILNR